MKNPSTKYAIIGALLVVFIIAALVFSQRTGNPAVTSNPQAEEPSSYVPQSEPVKVAAPSQPVPQQVVIQFAPEATDAERQAYVESIGGTVVESIASLDTVVVNVSEEVAQAPLPESDSVAVSEADYYVSALDGLAPVNDPHYVDQWALPAIAAPGAWASMAADAAAVTIAVIDSGICVAHPDLTGRIVSGWDFVEGDAVPQDDFGHGCSVSGVIAANMNDGIGIAGVAPNANIMPLRVLNASGFGSYSDVAAAVVYAADHGAQVINLSLGGTSPSSTLENAINYAASKGVIVVAAAGNNGTEGVLYPAAYNSVIAVGSVDPNLQHSTFSNYGSQVDVWAPGRDIMTTKRTGDYGLVSGTSFAAPYVAGAEAVYMALSRTPVFGGGLLTFADQIAVTAEPTTVVGETPTDTPVTEIDTAVVLDQLRALYNVPANYEASIQNIQQANGTMFGLFVVPVPAGVNANPSAHYFTAVQNGDVVTLSQEYTPQFSVALDALNAAGVLDQGLVTAFNSAAAQGDGSALLGLPWTAGTSATLLQGPHGDGFDPAAAVLSALDFAPANNKVTAAREGFAQKIICPQIDDAQSSWVVITHTGGWRTSYYQLTNIQVDTVGRQVARGEWIGDVAASSDSALLCGGSTFVQGLHFSVLNDGKQAKINGFDIGGWTVGGEGATGTLTKGVTTLNVGDLVSNDGTFGTNLSCEATSVPAGYIKCSDEGAGNTCNFNGQQTVYFGAGTCFANEIATSSIGCNSTAFNDVLLPSDELRSCYVDSHSSELAPLCPQSGGVILYANSSFVCTGSADTAGYRLKSTSGSQDVNDGSFDNAATSVRVPDGWSVMLYGDLGATGGYKACLNEDVNDLATLGVFPDTVVAIDNNVSSIEVFTNSTNCGVTTVGVASAPLPLLPRDGSSNAGGSPVNFQWQAAPNALDHQVEYWNNTATNTKLYCPGVGAFVAGNNFCEVTAPVAGTYSWHVKGRNGNQTVWSPLFTFTVRTNTPTVYLADMFTTDGFGPAGLNDSNILPAEDVSSNLTTDAFHPGDPIKLYLTFTNELPTDQTFTGDWLVFDPAGRVVPELTDTGISSTNGNDNGSYYWYRDHIIPDHSVRGTYTFIGKVTYNGVTTTQSRTFTVAGTQAVEVYDAFSTTGLGAASLADGPSVPVASAPSEVISKTTPTYNTGDGIRLYIDAFNDASAVIPATFDWAVIDPQGRHVPQLEWHGDLTSSLNHTWWSLPVTIPANMLTGDYIFTGSITYNGNTTSHSQTFHVNGSAAPANDAFASFVPINSVPYTDTMDTWKATTALNDPYSTCGGQNSNSVWYRYTPASNGLLEIDTSGSTYGVEIGVWTGTAGSLTPIVCNNIKDVISGEVLIENLPVTSGTAYYIELTDVGTPGGGILKLRVDFASSTALTNDDFNAPIVITNNTTINNVGASTSQNVSTASKNVDDPLILDACNRVAGKASVWYSYTTTFPGELVLDTIGSDYDTMISVWTGTRLNLTPIGCNDDIGDEAGVWNVDSKLTVALNADTTYYIQIAEFNGVNENVNGASLDGLGGKPSGVSAEFSGGTMHLNSKFNPAPKLDSPVDNYTYNTVVPVLSVFTLPGANTYEFQISNVPYDFSAPLVDVTVTAPNISYTFNGAPSGVYYWRVLAKDASSNASAWSAVRSFSVTSLLSPTNNSSISSTKPVFTWGATVGALEYNLQVDEAPLLDSAALEINNFQTTGTTFTPATALVTGDHYWKLRVRTAGGWSVFTPVWKFTILSPLTAPVLLTPANASATRVTTPLFSWNGVAGGNTYRIEIDNDSTFVSLDQFYTTAPGNALAYTANSLGDGTYYWRVKAINALGESGPWSLVRTVTIDTQSTDSPVLNLPANNGFTALAKPTFSVLPVVGATLYRFEVDEEPFTNPGRVPHAYSPYVSATSYTLTDLQSLPYGIYYWRARSKDAAGNFSINWSDVRTLYVTPMTAPVNDGYVTIVTPTFTWTAVTGALEYRLQVSKTNTFAVLEHEHYQNSGVSYVIPAMDYGLHYWRMQVRTAAGWGVWVPAWKFTVTPALTIAPVLTGPVSAIVTTDNTPTLTWNKVMDDDRYEVQIDNLSTFASPEQDVVNSLGVLNYTASTLPDGLYNWRVRTSNYLSVPGTWSAARTFTIDTTPPLAPVLSLPANSAVVIGTPAFSWTTTLTASRYQFEYDNDADFSSPTHTSLELTTTSYTPPIMAAPATYSWHVRAKDAAGNWGLWSTARLITVNPPTPVAPVLTSPATSLVTNDTTPDFLWAAVTGTGITYKLEISSSATFITPAVQTFTGGVGVLNYTATALPDGVYYWRVAALNAANVSSPWSASRTFTIDTVAPLAPVLTLPADSAVVVGTPAFSWAAALTAVKYQFEYDNDANFSSPTHTSLDLTTTSYTPPTMATLATYSWHVRAKDAAGNYGPWSTARLITINPPIPVAPVLTSPATGLVTNDTTPDFVWAVVAGTNITYKLEISSSATFITPAVQTFTGGVGVLNYTATALSDGVYYWRVAALNAANVAGPWATSRTFTIDTVGPVAPALSLPADNAAVVGTPAFSWLAAVTAVKYQFEYDNDANFSSPIHTSLDLTTTSYTPPAMATLATYSWHVRGKDAAGNYGAWSTARLITINPPIPVAPVLTSPLTGLVTNDTTPDFVWAAVAGTNITYKLEISSSATFITPAVQTFTGGVGILNYTATALSEGVYYWRVAALNAANVAGPWATSRIFTIDTTGPLAPVLSLPAGNAAVIGTPAFSWATAATAVKYQFEYDNDADFSSPTHTSLDLTTTSYTPPTMATLATYSWHVRAKDAIGNIGPWSTARLITINPATPVAPVLASPATSFVTNDTTPDFAWAAVAGTNITYKLEISSSPTFITPAVQTFTSGVGILNYTATALSEGVYYWRVAALNAANVAGPWSTSRIFTIDTTGPLAPVLSLPADSAAVVGTPAFSWAAAATAVTYQFEYDDNADFSSPTYTSIALTLTSHTPPTMTAPAAYSWHVRAKDAAGNFGSWGIARLITINPPTPVAPVLTSPATGFATNDTTPDFVWAAVAGTNITYKLEISSTSTFTPPAVQTFTGGVEVLNYTATALSDGVYYWRVAALNAANVAGPWATSRTFTIDTTGPVAPVLSLPADNAAVVGTPVFSWVAAATATKYQFEYDNDANFSSPTHTSLDLTTTSYTPPIMAAPATYSWHVRAKDALGNIGPWSTARLITVNPPTPVAPVLTSPATSLMTNDTTPDFVWAAVAGTGITYKLEISSSATFITPAVQTFTGGVGILNYTATALSDGVYYWRVAALNAANVAGPWSASRTFTIDTVAPLAPVLTLPADNAVVVGTPAFSWAVAVTAASYEFQYDDNADFSSPTFTSGALTTTSYTPPIMAAPATYSWHVRAKDAAGNYGSWSTARLLTINPVTPVAPVLTSPATSLVTNDTTPDFLWASVTGTGITYKLEISSSATFITPAVQTFTGGVGVLNYTATALPEGVYYWRVAALNAANVSSPWSASRTFTIDITGPLAPALTLPADSAAVVGTPAFSWAAAVTAASYEFQYDNNADFSSPIFTSGALTTTSYTPPTMATLATYSWHVRAKDAAGNYGPWSTARLITINPPIPVAPVLTSPATGLVTNDTTPDFAWAVVAGTNITYKLEISSSATFITPAVQTFTGGVGVLNYTAAALSDGVYYWRVAALNAANVAGPWAASRTFTIDTVGPVAPVLSLPADNAAVVGTPAFSWLAAATAVKYQFEYDNDANFSSPTHTSLDLTTTSYTPPSMATLATYSWHVRAKDAAGNYGAWSTARLITINPPVPVAPVLTSPLTGLVTNDTTPDFVWAAVAGTNITYKLEISSSATFITPAVQTFTGGVGVLNYTATALSDGVYYWRVAALNAANVAGPWATSRIFTIDTTGPVAPVLSLPANAAAVTGTPVFSWLAAVTASKYQFEYDNNSDFSSPTYTSLELTTTSHTPPTISLGTYSWHVRAKDVAGNWGPWSTARTVTVTPLTPAGVPTLLTPANSTIVLNPKPTMTWSVVTGAVSYQVQMDKNSTFSSPDLDTTTAATTLTSGTILADGVYYWRVRKVDVYGGVGVWSAVWRLSVNQPIPLAVITLSSQSDDGVFNSETGNPTFTWEAVEFGAKYQIQVDDKKDFGSPSFDDTAGTTSRTPSTSMTNGEYFWRVRAFNEYETPGPWSETWTVRINIPPVAPTLLLPLDAAEKATGTPAFSWQNTVNAEEYQIQLDDSSKFDSTEFDETTTSTGYTPFVPLADGEYYWRVRAMNMFGTAGEWSDAYTVVVSVPPTAPVLLTPEETSIDAAGTPTFTWDTVSNGDSYQIQVDDNADFSAPEFDDTAPTTTRELVTPLTDGTYFWRVRAMNIYDLAGEWSTVQTFTVSSLPPAPTLLTPATDGDEAETTATPTFTWEAVINGVTYQIQVDNNDDFSSPEVDNIASTTTRELSTSLVNGLYYWRVRAINMDGTSGEWSLVWNFAVDVENAAP